MTAQRLEATTPLPPHTDWRAKYEQESVRAKNWCASWQQEKDRKKAWMDGYDNACLREAAALDEVDTLRYHRTWLAIAVAVVTAVAVLEGIYIWGRV